MKSEIEISKQLGLARIALKLAEAEPVGDCKWRQAKRYVDALEWVLDLE